MNEIGVDQDVGLRLGEGRDTRGGEREQKKGAHVNCAPNLAARWCRQQVTLFTNSPSWSLAIQFLNASVYRFKPRPSVRFQVPSLKVLPWNGIWYSAMPKMNALDWM